MDRIERDTKLPKKLYGVWCMVRFHRGLFDSYKIGFWCLHCFTNINHFQRLLGCSFLYKFKLLLNKEHICKLSAINVLCSLLYKNRIYSYKILKRRLVEYSENVLWLNTSFNEKKTMPG